MKIIIDDKIPYIKDVFEPFADVIYMQGDKINNHLCKNADALIIRTRTFCNKSLLSGTKVKFIATATIGYDHIDTDFCLRNGIQWTNAPGCNAKSVEQYIASALFSFSMKKRFRLKDKKVGIIGVGNVGKNIEQFCKTLGIKTLLNDPPRERMEGKNEFVDLKNICDEADIITFHVPLILTGQDKTFQMVNKNFIENLKKKPLLINSCRGEVFETQTIKEALKKDKISGFIADCWENEPNIDKELLALSDYGTPHIAGYSRDGKATGTKMAVNAINNFFNLGFGNWEPENIEPAKETVIQLDGLQRRDESIISEAILSTYDIENDDETLKRDPSFFEKLRGEYPVRREFTSYKIKPVNIKKELLEKIEKIGFQIL